MDIASPEYNSHSIVSSIRLTDRKLEITLVSANSLPDIRKLGRMKVFAKVSIKGESRTRKRTPTDVQGKTNPRWNFPLSESAVQQPGVKLSIRLYCERLRGDKFFGQVDIPIKSLFDKGVKAHKILTYQLAATANILYSFGRETVLVRKPSGSGWKNMLEVGLFVLMGGAILLLGGGGGGGDEDDEPSDGVQDEDEDEDDDVFHDAR